MHAVQYQERRQHPCLPTSESSVSSSGIWSHCNCWSGSAVSVAHRNKAVVCERSRHLRNACSQSGEIGSREHTKTLKK